jgi:hypothetical protein
MVLFAQCFESLGDRHGDLADLEFRYFTVSFDNLIHDSAQLLFVVF